MLDEQGTIVAVSLRTVGDFLAGAHAAGGTTLTVTNAYVFSETGGSLTVDGDTYTYLADAVDDDASTITITSPLVRDYDDGAHVDVLPASTEKIATVVLAGQGEAIEARVPHTAKFVIPEGIRDPGAEESVSLTFDGEEWVIADVIGRVPLVDGAAIDPQSEIPSTAMTDGEPPSTSPTPEALGVIGLILLRWLGVVNADPVTYEVHVSQTPGFTPDASTMVGEYRSTQATVKTLADGTPLVYDTDYFFCLIAKDADGSATPSGQVSARMDKARAADLWADAIDGFTITGATLRTASAGQRVEITSAGGLVGIDSTGAVKTQVGTDGFFHAVGADIAGTVKADIFSVIHTVQFLGTDGLASARIVCDEETDDLYLFDRSGGFSTVIAGNVVASSLGDPSGATALKGGNITVQGPGSWDKKLQKGSASLVLSTANAYYQKDVIFPTPFDSTPRVVITPSGATLSTITFNWWVENETSTGFRIRGQRSGAATIDFNWIAIA